MRTRSVPSVRLRTCPLIHAVILLCLAVMPGCEEDGLAVDDDGEGGILIEGGEVQAGDVYAGDVAAGAVQAGEVQAGDVNAGNVQAGDIDLGDVAAGEVFAGDVFTGDVNVGPITAGTVSAGGVQAGAVQAGTVQAGTVQAGDVQVGDCQAGEVLAGDVDLGQVDLTIHGNGLGVPLENLELVWQTFQWDISQAASTIAGTCPGGTLADLNVVEIDGSNRGVVAVLNCP